MRQLWTEEKVTFEGQYYRTKDATIYDRPATPVPIYVAAAGALIAKYAGRMGDGLDLHQRQGARALHRNDLAESHGGARPRLARERPTTPG